MAGEIRDFICYSEADDVESVKALLLGKPKDIINKCIGGKTLIAHAISYKRFKIADYLISLGADVNKQSVVGGYRGRGISILRGELVRSRYRGKDGINYLLSLESLIIDSSDIIYYMNLRERERDNEMLLKILGHPSVKGSCGTELMVHCIRIQKLRKWIPFVESSGITYGISECFIAACSYDNTTQMIRMGSCLNISKLLNCSIHSNMKLLKFYSEKPNNDLLTLLLRKGLSIKAKYNTNGVVDDEGGLTILQWTLCRVFNEEDTSSANQLECLNTLSRVGVDFNQVNNGKHIFEEYVLNSSENYSTCDAVSYAGCVMMINCGSKPPEHIMGVMFQLITRISSNKGSQGWAKSGEKASLDNIMKLLNSMGYSPWVETPMYSTLDTMVECIKYDRSLEFIDSLFLTELEKKPKSKAIIMLIQKGNKKRLFDAIQRRLDEDIGTSNSFCSCDGCSYKRKHHGFNRYRWRRPQCFGDTNNFVKCKVCSKNHNANIHKIKERFEDLYTMMYLAYSKACHKAGKDTEKIKELLDIEVP